MFLTARTVRGEYAAATRRRNYHTLTRFAHEIDDPPVRQVTRRHVDKYLGRLTVCARTRRNYLVVVRTFLGWCETEGMMERSPLAGVKMPPVVRTVPRQLRAGEVAQVLEACPDSRARLIVTLMVQLGLRCCEVASLTWDGIDPVAGTVVVTGKGGHMRALPLLDEVDLALDEYLRDVQVPPQGLVVRSLTDRQRGVRSDTVSTLVSRVFAASGVKTGRYDGRSAHAARHTCAGDVLRRGGHLRDVQAMLGHQSLATTQTYLPLLVGDLRTVMEGRCYRRSAPPSGAA